MLQTNTQPASPENTDFSSFIGSLKVETPKGKEVLENLKLFYSEFEFFILKGTPTDSYSKKCKQKVTQMKNFSNKLYNVTNEKDPDIILEAISHLVKCIEGKMNDRINSAKHLLNILSQSSTDKDPETNLGSNVLQSPAINDFKCLETCLKDVRSQISDCQLKLDPLTSTSAYCERVINDLYDFVIDFGSAISSFCNYCNNCLKAIEEHAQQK